MFFKKQSSQPADKPELSVNCVIVLISWFITNEEKTDNALRHHFPDSLHSTKPA